ncbi:Deoxyribose-phosphate aldolase [Symbiodinium microadriaticum]|uniref:deoxyribose-phosphate aldolase n=1 Tax=Symbiodinium microadriaticum TaxID=2951 RepID=A0A1Q9DY05_SYMMI|nr:Deoxyribose-phosphate aldolase [Symbiodinium microadriaticum]
MEPGETSCQWQPRAVLRVFLPLLMLVCIGRTYLADSRLSWGMEVVRGEMKRLAPAQIFDLMGQLSTDENGTLQAPSIANAAVETTRITVPSFQTTLSPQQPSATSISASPSSTSITLVPTTNPTSTTSTPVPVSKPALSNDMPSVFFLADQQSLLRSNTKCPPEVRVSEWNGRIGNHFFQVSQAIVAALFCHITRVKFPPHISTRYQQQDGLLDMPEELTLPGVDRHEELKVPNSCPKQLTHKWYHQHCQMVPAWHHQQVMHKFLWPYLGQNLTDLVHSPQESAADGVLTIHLRADDIRQYGRYEWAQPPCSMYQKIMSDYGYKTLMVVAKSNPVTRRSDAACDSWLVDYGRLHGIKILRPKDISLAGDLATMIRAKKLGIGKWGRNFVLSFSSFSLSTALLSNDLQEVGTSIGSSYPASQSAHPLVMYRRRDAKWHSILHAIVNCNAPRQMGEGKWLAMVWTGVTLYEYNTSLQEERKGSPSALGLGFALAGLGRTMAMTAQVAKARQGAGPEDYVLVMHKMCPFAQRAWFAMEESGLNFKLKEVGLGSGSNALQTAVPAVCVFPEFIQAAKVKICNDLGQPDAMRVATVVNFPSGDSSVTDVAPLLQWEYLNTGGSPKSCDLVRVAKGLLEQYCAETGRSTLLKVILETGELCNPDLIAKASLDAFSNGADFIKTSTGKTKVGATLEAVQTMLRVILDLRSRDGDKVVQRGLKVSGGVRTYDDAMSYIKLVEQMLPSGEFLHPRTFRFGVSGLLANLLKDESAGNSGSIATGAASEAPGSTY